MSHNNIVNSLWKPFCFPSPLSCELRCNDVTHLLVMQDQFSCGHDHPCPTEYTTSVRLIIAVFTSVQCVLCPPQYSVYCVHIRTVCTVSTSVQCVLCSHLYSVYCVHVRTVCTVSTSVQCVLCSPRYSVYCVHVRTVCTVSTSVQCDLCSHCVGHTYTHKCPTLQCEWTPWSAPS